MHLIILSESHPKRCEVCHQSDRFDPETNSCQRCVGSSFSLTLSETKPVLWVPQFHLLANIRHEDLTGFSGIQKWTVLSSLPHIVLFYFVHFYLHSHYSLFEMWITELFFMGLLASFPISWFIGITSFRLANALFPENTVYCLLFLGTCLHFFPTVCLIYIYFAGGRGLFGYPGYCATS
ncbi:MAG: hypothetical protein HY774_08140 [Acidobacteria bacterium]|nr:hypothetical protein [Acidobacteriota bacterium]